jgi:ribosomal protein S27AE
MSIEKNIFRILEEIKKSEELISEAIILSESSKFSPPLSKLIVASPFGPRWGSHHNGVDLNAVDEPVKSLADGVVITTHKDKYPCGGTIVIKHSDGYTTGFCHMQKINVQVGQEVKKGDIIGITGGGKGDPGKGRSTGKHLHLVIKKDGIALDPMNYIDKEGILSGEEIPSSSFSDSDEVTQDSIDNDNVTPVLSNDDTLTTPNDKEDFEYGGWKKDSKLSENIKRIKNLL